MKKDLNAYLTVRIHHCSQQNNTTSLCSCCSTRDDQTGTNSSESQRHTKREAVSFWEQVMLYLPRWILRLCSSVQIFRLHIVWLAWNRAKMTFRRLLITYLKRKWKSLWFCYTKIKMFLIDFSNYFIILVHNCRAFRKIL